MNRIDLDLPRPRLVLNVCVAALAAVGLSLLSGAAQGQAVVGVPVLTALLTFALLARPAKAAPERWEDDEPITTDPTTGLTTEEIAREALRREFAAAQRGRPLTVALVRLEGLARYRAQHGGPVADQLVRVAGRTLVRHRRGMHVAAARGPEGTFLSILSGSDLQGAGVYAARLRADLMQPRSLPPIEGVSIGIAAFDVSMESPGDLVRRAAYALEKGAEAGGKVMVVGQQRA
jgi:GGDEF domain-containing protein